MNHNHFNSLQASPGVILLEDQDLYAYHESSHVIIAHTPERSLQESKDNLDSFHHARTIRLYEVSNAATSMVAIPFLFGAIRPGGVVDVFSSRFIGLPLNWFLLGFFDGAIASILSPLLHIYLGYTQAQLNAVQGLFGVLHLFKAVMGFLSDCVPIKHQRRKPYMIIGWIILSLFMCAIVFFKNPTPYKRDGAIVHGDAASQGPRYLMMVFAGMFGHLMCTAACEGMMIEFSHREGEYGRGRAQCICLYFRFAGEALGGISTSLALNSAEYGGVFGTAVPTQILFATYALLAVIGLAVTLLFVCDEKIPTSSQRFLSHLRRIWHILRKPTTWETTLVGFFVSIGIFYTPFDSDSVYADWLGASSLTIASTNAISSSGSSLAAALYMAVVLEKSWRRTIFAAISMGLLISVLIDTLTVHNVYRSLATTMATMQVTATLDGVVFVAYLLVVVEVAEPAYEAVVYGILTTVANLAVAVNSMLNNVVATHHTSVSLAQDTPTVRNHVMREFLAKYVLRVIAVFFVWLLLPRQKRELRVRSVHNTSNLVRPLILLTLFALLFGVSVMSDVLALFPATSCLVIAGGSGC